MTSEFHLERMYAQLGYYEYDKAEEHLKDAIEKANLTVQLSGVLGKRTKFQQTNIAQLVAKVCLLFCTLAFPLKIVMNESDDFRGEVKRSNIIIFKMNYRQRK